MNIGLDKKSNFHEPNNITLGFDSGKTLKDMKKDDFIEDSGDKQFPLDCKTFLTKIIKKKCSKGAL